jgi:hypothetical protein
MKNGYVSPFDVGKGTGGKFYCLLIQAGKIIGE